jgi:hypothetical protein
LRERAMNRLKKRHDFYGHLLNGHDGTPTTYVGPP